MAPPPPPPRPAVPKEELPDAVPLPAFFFPNVIGFGLALGLERFHVEQRMMNFILSFLSSNKSNNNDDAKKYALLGLGIFALANANSYLGGSVVNARVQYGVKFPNLYAPYVAKPKDDDDNDDKCAKEQYENAVMFNCIQRGHQNFLEMYAQLTLTVLFTALVADRPNIAGMICLVVAMSRVRYAQNYRSKIQDRVGPIMVVIVTMSIGIGYGLLIALTGLFDLNLLAQSSSSN